MRVLITGVTGFAGSHLAAFLLKKKKTELFGLRRPGSRKTSVKGVRLIACDLLDEKNISSVLKKVKPERIFHLAASASVAESWKDPKGTFENNVRGTEHLLRGVRQYCPQARVHVAGSGEVYGRSRGKKGLRESDPLHPLNPYARSKVAQEKTALRYHTKFGIHVVCTRAFNHFGPGQSAGFVASDFARQVAEIEAGKKVPVMEVGNLTAVRDFTDVRDVVRAYWICLEVGLAGEVYNVACGRGRSVRQLLDSYLKRSAVRISVRQNKALFRKVDAPVLVGDAGKLWRRSGWKPQIPFERTTKDILDYWRMEAKR